MLAGVAVALSIAALADNVDPERRAKMMERRAARLAAAGGLVTKPASGNYARVVSMQKTVPLSYVKEVVRQFNTGLNINIEVSEMPPEATPFESVKKVMGLPRTGIALVIVEDSGLPTILSAMEDGWAILEIGKLDDDMPPREVYDMRVRKEINRAFAQAFGAGLSMNKPCVMEPAYTLPQLDAIKFPVISPEAMNKMMDACYKRSIEPLRMATYKTACQQGWAPPPTNDVQKAIWKETHAIPKTPMKIEFDPKKGR